MTTGRTRWVGSGRRGVRAGSRAIPLAVVLALPALGLRDASDVALAADPPSYFSVDVTLAPRAIDGQFPLSIELGANDLDTTLAVDTSVRGALDGRFDVGGRTFNVTGRVTHTRKRTRAVFVARAGKNHIAFDGTLRGTALTGTATGKGAVAKGRHRFTLDLAGAGPLVATIEAALRENRKGKVWGDARVRACGETVGLSAAGTRGKKQFSFGLNRTGRFHFAGRGGAAASPSVLSWSVTGFGATASGKGLVLDPLAPVSGIAYPVAFAEWETEAAVAPLAPSAGTAPRARFGIGPALPAGLAIDPATGTISGTPTEIRSTTTYTITVANYAGSMTTTVDLQTRIPRAKSFAPDARIAAGTLSGDDLRHLLVRTQFGVTQTAFDRVQSIGVDAFIDGMLAFSQNGPAEAIAAPELVNASDPVGLEGKFPNQTQLGRWWSSLMMNTDNPFQERLAFFWHDHFAASAENLEGGETHFMQDYVNLFRYEGHGDLRALLLKMARDPCMLKYLDGYQNRATAPNENFAREFWELFTLGVDNGYTQADIVQAAKAFTGYKQSTNPTTGLVSMVFDKNRHDKNAKSFLAQTIAAQDLTDDYAEVVRITVENRPVAEFIVTRLFEHFAFERPSQALVDLMAADLRGSGYDISAFLRNLFRSEAFFSPTARQNLVKNPVDYSLGFIHTTGLKLQVSTLGNHLATLAQFPTQPPTVNGWPQNAQWLSAQNVTDRLNMAYACVEDTTRQNANGMNVSAVLPPAGPRGAPEVVDHVATLLRVTLTPTERDTCIAYLDTQVGGTGSNPTGTPSTFDATLQTHLDSRLRGLLYILAQHPSYEIR